MKFIRFQSHYFQALLISIFLVFAIFPDVIFLGASVRLTDQLEGSNSGKKSIQFYEVPTTTGWWGSYSDTGGGIFQAEPMISLMKKNIREGQSPYWNPYSAAGSLGPETLVDQKFSPFTIINAAIGDKSIVFNLTYILISAISIYFLYLIISDILGLSIYAAIGSCVFYLLNGYVVANMGSNTLQSFYYIPVVIYACYKFIDVISLKSFAIMGFAWSLIFACTFLPTTIISVVAITILIIGFILFRCSQEKKEIRKTIILIGGLIGGGVIAVLLLSVIYIPLIENITTMGTLNDYAKRVFFPINFPQAIAALYTPTHLFESYNAMEPGAIFWNDGKTKNGLNGNTVYHIGVIAIILSVSAYVFISSKYKYFILFCYLCLGIGLIRLFNVEIIGKYIDQIPVIGNIGCQYWWPMVFLPITFLAAFGLEAFVQERQKILISMFFLMVGVLSIYYVYTIYGLKEPNIPFKIQALKNLLIFSIVIIITLISSKYIQSNKIHPILLVIFLFAELIYDAKSQREPRVNFFNEPATEIAYIKENIGMSRTLNIGGAGLYPELGSAFGIQEATSLNQGILPYYLEYFGSMIQLENKNQMMYGASLLNMKDEPDLNKIDWDKINLLGIKYILLPKDFIKYQEYFHRIGITLAFRGLKKDVYENPYVLPRAFAIPISNENIEKNTSIDSKNINLKTPVEITEYKNKFVRLEGIVTERSLIVLTDNYTPLWSVVVNGDSSKIVTIDNVFRGVIVEPGTYKVDFDYSLKYLNLAIFLSLSTLIGLVAFLFVSPKNNKKHLA